jgi:hypothetical protein
MNICVHKIIVDISLLLMKFKCKSNDKIIIRFIFYEREFTVFYAYLSKNHDINAKQKLFI